MDFLIGTLTRTGGAGISYVRYEKGKLRSLWTDETIDNPIWISKAPNGHFFSVGTASATDNTGYVYEIDACDRGMKVLTSEATGGKGPCHLSLSSNARFLYCANYQSGSLAVFPITQEGLQPLSQKMVHQGRSVNEERQSSPHVHQVTPIPGYRNRFCACDLGTDELVIYEHSAQNGTLKRCYKIHVPSGEGPRHIAYGPRGQAWLVTEMGCHLYSVHFDAEHGSVGAGVTTTIETPAASGTIASAIRVNANGTRIYVSNRGEGSIVCMDGCLHPIFGWKTSGAIPRDFILLEDDLILVACQDQGMTLIQNGKTVDSLTLSAAVSVLAI